MAPLTCQVLDAEAHPLQGIHVAVEAKDQCQNAIAKFESYTNELGCIDSWFPFPSPGHTEIIQPIIIDSRFVPRLNIVFFPIQGGNSYGAWTRLQSDMLLIGNDSHHVTLRLNKITSSYQIEHSSPSPITLDHHMEVDHDQLFCQKIDTPLQYSQESEAVTPFGVVRQPDTCGPDELYRSPIRTSINSPERLFITYDDHYYNRKNRKRKPTSPLRDYNSQDGEAGHNTNGRKRGGRRGRGFRSLRPKRSE